MDDYFFPSPLSYIEVAQELRTIYEEVFKEIGNLPSYDELVKIA